MKVYLNIPRSNALPHTGIGQVLLAQYALLPRFGIETTDTPDNADVIAIHVEGGNLTAIDCLHCHGLYFKDVPHLPYDRWHLRVNAKIGAWSRRASHITVPSEWVGEVFRRDLRIQPSVIGHGVTPEAWQRASDPGGYLYYNKNRETDVCTSRWAAQLAARFPKEQVVSTFQPEDQPTLPNLRVTGLQSHDEVIRTMQGAGVYLSTTLETFGIGTLEALASGVPVLGFDWGGNRDIVDHKGNGYLAEPGNLTDLVEGLGYIRAHWHDLSAAAIAKAQAFRWEAIIEQYARLYQGLPALRHQRERSGVSIVIPNHNYGQWVGTAIDSALAQSLPCEVIVVDDGSTDESRRVIAGYGEKIRALFQENQGVAAARNAGIAAASHEMIFLLDADDWIEPQTVEVLARAMRADAGLGIAYTGLTLADAGGHDLNTSPSWPPEFDWTVQSRYAVPPANCIPSACLIRKAMWRRAGGFQQRFAPGEDAEFWTRGLSVGFTARRVVPEGLFHYRNHGGGASKVRKYVPTDAYLPFLHDQDYPMAAPIDTRHIEVRSYLTPAVSVIIPVGPDHTELVREAIWSVVGQTLREWEILLVNDSGRDLSALRETFPFVKILTTPGRAGAGAARNLGIAAARAPTVLFLDADDLLQPQALQHLMARFLEMGGRYIYSDWSADTGGDLETFQSTPYNQSEWRMVHPVTVLMATEQARSLGFDETLPGWEDWDFFVKAATRGVCGDHLAENLLTYRTRTGQRRKQMQDLNSAAGQQVLQVLRERYLPFYTGEKPMSSCCGGESSIQAAKRILGQSEGTPAPSAGASTALVRMEYIGENIGEISFQAHGRVYRGGNNPLHRYKDVLPEDVEVLERTSRWRRVTPLPSPAPFFPGEPAQPPADEDEPGAPATPYPAVIAPPEEISAEMEAQAQVLIEAAQAKIREESRPAEPVKKSRSRK